MMHAPAAATAASPDSQLHRLPLFQPSIFVTEALLARTHMLMASLHWMGLHQQLLMVLALLAGIAGVVPYAMRMLSAL